MATSNKTITLVAAMGSNRAIGHEGAIPWHVPGELQHFKATTMGHSIVMGRLTFESIGRALPGRQNIVVTRNRDFSAEGVVVAHSLREAIDLAETEEVMVIGGGQLYREALPLASRMVLTRVPLSPQADTWFPEWQASEWRPVRDELRRAADGEGMAFEIVELVRIQPPDGA